MQLLTLLIFSPGSPVSYWRQTFRLKIIRKSEWKIWVRHWLWSWRIFCIVGQNCIPESMWGYSLRKTQICLAINCISSLELDLSRTLTLGNTNSLIQTRLNQNNRKNRTNRNQNQNKSPKNPQNHRNPKNPQNREAQN